MPTYITCSVSPCDVSIALSNPVLDLSAADGVLLAGAILGVWAVGWAIRMLISVLHSDEVKGNDGE